jgi:hypothetical protein
MFFLWFILRSCQYLDFIVSRGRIIAVGKDLEGNCRGPIQVVFRNIPDGTEKTTKILRIVGVPAEIRTEHLKNTNVECYRYTNPLGGGDFDEAMIE